MQTLNDDYIEVKNGDHITVIGRDFCDYSGVVSEPNTRLKKLRRIEQCNEENKSLKKRSVPREIVKDADLSSNFWRLTELNGVLL